MHPWSRGREIARDVLRSSPKPEKTLFLPSERDREFWSPVFYTAAPKPGCIRRLASARHGSPAVCEHCDQRVGRTPYDERAPFKFHGAAVGVVDQCLSRTRNLAASN